MTRMLRQKMSTVRPRLGDRPFRGQTARAVGGRIALGTLLTAVFLAVLLAPSAPAFEIPPVGSPVFVQTSGARAGINIGDWYTNVANGSVSGYTYITIHVPSDWPSDQDLHIDLFSPEMNAGNALDEQRGTADTTFFEVYDAGTLVSLEVIDGLLDVDADRAVTAADDGTLFVTGDANGIAAIDGFVDVNDDSVIDATDDGTFAGFSIVDGYVDVDGDGIVPEATDDDYLWATPSPGTPTAAHAGNDSCLSTTETASLIQCRYLPQAGAGTWKRAVTLTAPVATGRYVLRAQTGDGSATVTTNDDDNAWRLRVGLDDDGDPTTAPPANTDNPDLVDGTNDELVIGLVQVTYQHNEATDQTLTLYEFVPRAQPSVTFHNFDVDGNISVTYIAPSGGTTAGTVSGNAGWNNDPAPIDVPPIRYGDTISNPEEGWWQIDTLFTPNNQIIQEGRTSVPGFFEQPPTPIVDVLKDDGKSRLSAGDRVTWTITFTNVSDDPARNMGVTPGAAVNLVLTDSVPSQTTYVGCGINAPFTGSCSESGGVVTYTINEALVAGGTGSVTLTADVDPTAAGVIFNRVVVDFEDSANVATFDVETDADLDLLPGTCFAVARGPNTTTVDRLIAIDRTGGGFQDIGPTTGATDIRAVAFEPGTDTLFSVDNAAAGGPTLGTHDLTDGSFTALGPALTTCTAAGGPRTILAVEGLSFDPVNANLWASAGTNVAADAIFQLDRTTGAVVPNLFGPGIDCLDTSLNSILDIAIDPTGAPLYASDGTTLYTVNTTTGVAVPVGPFGAGAITDMAGIAFNNGGNLSGSTGATNTPAANSDNLWSINETTGVASFVYDFSSAPSVYPDYEALACLTDPANRIRGTVFNDLNVNGIYDPATGDVGQGGVTVRLYLDNNNDGLVDPGDTLIQTTTTAADGSYGFFVGVPGNYVVDTDFPATYPATAVLTTDNVEEADFTTTGQTDVGNDFGFSIPGDLAVTKSSNAVGDVVAGQTIVYTITITNPAGPLQTGVTVSDPVPAGTSFNACAINAPFTGSCSESGGVVSYTINEALDNAGTIVVTLTVVVEDPLDYSRGQILNVATASSNQSAPVQAAVSDPVSMGGSIGDRVWLDTDGDGIQDIGEPGLGNVTVQLISVVGAPGGDDDIVIATTVTDTDGNYVFDGIAPGTYYVNVVDATVPTGLARTAGNGEPADGPPRGAPGRTFSITAEEVYDTADYGYVPSAGTAAVGDYVWSDADGDGVQDLGEPGIGGVTVNLVSAGADGVFGTGDDVVEDSVTTAADGSYLFTSVSAGEYIVVLDSSNFAPGGALEGSTPTSGPQSQGADRSAPLTVLAGDVWVDADFGYLAADLRTIRDAVWLDSNADGVRDAGEPGIEGVTVTLIDDANGNGVWDVGTEAIIATTVTDVNGDFAFTGLEDGTYVVVVEDRLGRLRGKRGTTPPGLAKQLSRTLAGGDLEGESFGYANAGQVTGIVWRDADGDGVQDPGEAGIPGVTVELQDGICTPGVNCPTATTDASGGYSFDGLAPAGYTVVVTDLGPDGLPGTGDEILTGSTQTGDPDEAGTCATCDGQGAAGVGSESGPVLEFGYRDATLPDVSGTVFEDADADGVQDAGENGLAGVTLDLVPVFSIVGGAVDVDGSGTIDASDDGSLEGIAVIDGGLDVNGDGAVDASDDGFVAGVAIIDGLLDLDGDGTAGEAVDDSGILEGGPAATTTTDASGDYVFPQLLAGDYLVRVTDTGGVLGGYTLTSGLDEIGVTVAGTDVTGVDFGYTRESATGSIGDSVWLDGNGDGVRSASEAGISGVTVDLIDVGPDGVLGTADDVGVVASTVTGADGRYVFSGLPAGNYVVDVTDTGGELTGLALTAGSSDPSATIALSEGERYRDADFGYVPSAGTAALGDRVWYDTDGDGFQDPGEVGIAGVDVQILGTSAGTSCNPVPCTVTTGPDGSWLVTGLAPGDYVVTYDVTSLPAGYGPSPTNNGGNRTYNATVAAGESSTNLDFGFNGGTTFVVSDRVWLDADGDGVVDAGEAGIGGVTLTLLDASGNVVASTVTGDGTYDANGDSVIDAADIGYYEFSGVPAGAYTVVVTDVSGVLTSLQQTGDPDEPGTTCTACDDQYTVAVAADLTTADFGYSPSGGTGTIGDVIWRDLDADAVQDTGEPGVEGVTVELWLDVDGDGVITPGVDNLVRTELTDENGLYEFKGLPDGEYIVRVTDLNGVLSGLDQTADPDSACPGVGCDNETPVTLAGGVGDYTADFGYSAGADLVIGGTVFSDENKNATFEDGVEPEVGAATVRLYRYDDLNGDGDPDPGEPFYLFDTTTTDANGDYVFTDLPPGDYFVAVSTAGTSVDGYEQTTQTATGGIQPVELVAADSTGNDFGYWTGIVVTPVTLAYFEARGGGTVEFRWMTATEVGNLGFNLYEVTEKSLTRLNEELIVSHVVDSLEPQVYEYEAGGVAGDTFVLEDVDINGVSQYHGPFGLNASSGSAVVETKPIAWGAVRAASTTSRAVAKQGALPFAAADGGGSVRSLAAERSVECPTCGAVAAELVVERDGIYRVRYEDLLAAGVDFAGAPASGLALTSQGREVEVTTGGGGTFGPGSYAEFVGEAVETLYTKANLYRLTVDRGRSNGATGRRAGGASRRGAAESFYVETTRVERDVLYHFASPTEDPWYEKRLLATSGPVSVDVAFDLDGWAPRAAPVELTVGVWGVTNFPVYPDHHLLVEVNGTRVTEAYFDGLSVPEIRVEVPDGVLAETGNVVTLRLPHDTGADYDLVNYDHLELRYPRRFVARDGALTFASSGSAFRVQGFGSSEVVVYGELEGERRRLPVSVEGVPGSYVARFAGLGEGARYWVSTVEAMGVPGVKAAGVPVDITSGRADVLVIAHRDFISGLAPWVEQRASEGLTVKVVDVAEIYRQFSAGIVSPEAIQAFIGYGYETMGTRYVLLVGGDTFDYHDNLALGSVSFVPTLYGSTGSIVRFAPVDPLYGDVDGDLVPDVTVGRWPVRTVEELAAVIEKTLGYDPAGADLRAVLAADATDLGSGYSFRGASEEMGALLGEEWSLERVYLDELPVASATERLVSAIDSGAALVSYFGHSGLTVWSAAGLFKAADVERLANAERPTVVTQWGCWNTYHVEPRYETLGSRLLLEPERGAAAVLGASTLTAAESERRLGRAVFKRFAVPGTRLGDALTAAKAELASTDPDRLDVILGWTLLGDPTLLVAP